MNTLFRKFWTLRDCFTIRQVSSEIRHPDSFPYFTVSNAACIIICNLVLDDFPQKVINITADNSFQLPFQQVQSEILSKKKKYYFCWYKLRFREEKTFSCFFGSFMCKKRTNVSRKKIKFENRIFLLFSVILT